MAALGGLRTAALGPRVSKPGPVSPASLPSLRESGPLWEMSGVDVTQTKLVLDSLSSCLHLLSAGTRCAPRTSLKGSVCARAPAHRLEDAKCPALPLCPVLLARGIPAFTWVLEFELRSSYLYTKCLELSPQLLVGISYIFSTSTLKQKTVFILCVQVFLPAYVCTTCMPGAYEARRGCPVPWIQSYRCM